MSANADQKIKSAAKKPPLALIPFIWLYGVARVLAYGAVKYAKGNHYAATLDDGAGERYAGATQRHLADMQEPDGTWSRASLAARDHESGLPSIDHAICSLGILRGILVKEGVLPSDPGEAKAPPASDGWANLIAGMGHVPSPFHTADGDLRREYRPTASGWVRKLSTWDQINEVVLDHPDPERPLPPRDVVEAEWRAPLVVEDIEAPEPAADAVTVVVEDVASAAEDRYQRLLAHRVAKGAYDVVPCHDTATAAPDPLLVLASDYPNVTAQIQEAVADGPRSFAYINAHCTAYGQELFDILNAMVAAGMLKKDASGFSLGGGKTPGRP